MLESEIGVEVFTRPGRSNGRNRFGEAFLRASLAAQRGLATPVAGVCELAGVDAGTVGPGFLVSLGMATVPRLLRHHHDRYPGGNVNCTPGPDPH